MATASDRVSAPAGAAPATMTPVVKAAASNRPRKLLDIPYPRIDETDLCPIGRAGPQRLGGVPLSFFHVENFVVVWALRKRSRVALPGRPEPAALNRRS